MVEEKAGDTVAPVPADVAVSLGRKQRRNNSFSSKNKCPNHGGSLRSLKDQRDTETQDRNKERSLEARQESPIH